MNERTRGYIEISVGIALLLTVLIVGIGISSILGYRYSQEFGYYFVMQPIILSLSIGLLSGILLLSGYLRASGKRK